MSIGETSYDRINDYSAVKISLEGGRTTFAVGRSAKSRSRRRLITVRIGRSAMVCFASAFWTGKRLGMRLRQVPWHEIQGHDLRSLRREGDSQPGAPCKRMGHIELAAPTVHIWFFKAMPSRLGNLLDMKTTSLEKVIYFQDYDRRGSDSSCISAVCEESTMKYFPPFSRSAAERIGPCRHRLNRQRRCWSGRFTKYGIS